RISCALAKRARFPTSIRSCGVGRRSYRQTFNNTAAARYDWLGSNVHARLLDHPILGFARHTLPRPAADDYKSAASVILHYPGSLGTISTGLSPMDCRY